MFKAHSPHTLWPAEQALIGCSEKTWLLECQSEAWPFLGLERSPIEDRLGEVLNELMHCIGDFLSNLFPDLLGRIEVAMAINERRPHFGFGAAVPDRKVQRKAAAVAGKSKVEELIKGVTQVVPRHDAANVRVSAHTAALIEPL
jgi:hypothetical protein